MWRNVNEICENMYNNFSDICGAMLMKYVKICGAMLMLCSFYNIHYDKNISLGTVSDNIKINLTRQ